MRSPVAGARLLQEQQSLMNQRAKMSVAAQFKAIGPSHHPIGHSGLKTRSGTGVCGGGQAQKITQKIILNYEQVLLSQSNEQRKQVSNQGSLMNSQSPSGKQSGQGSPIRDFTQLDGTAEKETALRDGGQPASPQYCRDIELQSKVKQGAEGMKQDRVGKQSSQALFEEAH